MKASPIAVDSAFVWCATKSPDGKTAYFGTGDEGKIYAVDVDGKETRGKKVATVEAAWVTALLARADGTLLAASTPGGKIFSVDPKKGTSKLFATLPADHVWTLAEGKGGLVYAGTGGPGKIFAIERRRSAASRRQIWDSGDKHIVSLLVDDDRHLYVGTSEEAILFRVSHRREGRGAGRLRRRRGPRHRQAGGRPLRRGQRLRSRGSGASTPAAAAAAQGDQGHRRDLRLAASAGALPRPGQRKAKAAALQARRRRPHRADLLDRRRLLHRARPSTARGAPSSAPGSEGRVYRVAPDRTAALAIDIPERQALALLRTANGFLVGSGDVGGVYRAEPAAAKQATYLSRVLDADVRARWGLLRWHGDARARGREPLREHRQARRDLVGVRGAREAARAPATAAWVRSASPPARYVQYRVTFPAADARLGAVTLAYLPQNQRARITELTAGDGSGAAPPRRGGWARWRRPPPRRPRATPPVIKLRWKVENPDGDELGYRLSFREENEAVWRPLGGPDPLTKTDFDWNTEGLPDGTYVVRVVRQRRSRPAARAVARRVVHVGADPGRQPQARGRGAGGALPVRLGAGARRPEPAHGAGVRGRRRRVAAAVAGRRHRDDLVEAFTVKLPALAPGPHAVTVRAWDSADNVGAAALTVTVKGK